MTYREQLGFSEPLWVEHCPFCNHLPDVKHNLRDVLHRVTLDGSVWTFNCLEGEGGCGASVLGDSPQDAVARWNRRVTPVLATVRERLQNHQSLYTPEQLERIKQRGRELAEEGIDVDCLGPATHEKDA